MSPPRLELLPIVFRLHVSPGFPHLVYPGDARAREREREKKERKNSPLQFYSFAEIVPRREESSFYEFAAITEEQRFVVDRNL